MFITTFQGLSKGWTAIFLTLARELIFFIPAILILPRYLGLNGVWLSIPIADVSGTAIAGFGFTANTADRKAAASGIMNRAPSPPEFATADPPVPD